MNRTFRILDPRLMMGLAVLAFAGCGDKVATDVEPTPDGVIDPGAADVTGTMEEGDMPGNDLGTIAPMPGDELPTLGQPSPDSMAIEPADDPVIDPPEDAVEEPVFDLPDAEAPVEDDEPDGLSSIAFGHGLAVGLVATPRVELEAITYEDLLKQIAASDAKLTLVDGWASWCAPCKENFPHVTAMAKAYSDAGLDVIAMSFDAGTEVPALDKNQIAEAEAFLKEQDLEEVQTYRLDHLQFDMFETFKIGTIPAVFLFDADGKEIARFTYDDPADQFTYDQVEAKVAEVLGVECKGVVEAE